MFDIVLEYVRQSMFGIKFDNFQPSFDFLTYGNQILTFNSGF